MPLPLLVAQAEVPRNLSAYGTLAKYKGKNAPFSLLLGVPGSGGFLAGMAGRSLGAEAQKGVYYTLEFFFRF
jgi:hypothetical protein